jgi:hypothetical protein
LKRIVEERNEKELKRIVEKIERIEKNCRRN